MPCVHPEPGRCAWGCPMSMVKIALRPSAVPPRIGGDEVPLRVAKRPSNCRPTAGIRDRRPLRQAIAPLLATSRAGLPVSRRPPRTSVDKCKTGPRAPLGRGTLPAVRLAEDSEPLQPLARCAASTRATCSASRCAPSAIWWRQLVPSATTMASGAARTAGSRLSSAICIDTSWCEAS